MALPDTGLLHCATVTAPWDQRVTSRRDTDGVNLSAKIEWSLRGSSYGAA